METSFRSPAWAERILAGHQGVQLLSRTDVKEMIELKSASSKVMKKLARDLRSLTEQSEKTQHLHDTTESIMAVIDCFIEDLTFQELLLDKHLLQAMLMWTILNKQELV